MRVRPLFKNSKGWGFVFPAISGGVDLVYLNGEPKEHLDLDVVEFDDHLNLAVELGKLGVEIGYLADRG